MENPANKTLNVIKDVTQLKCSFTQNIIQDNDIFYVVPVQYYLNYEFRMIFIPRTIFSKPDRLVSPVIQCQLVNKNVLLQKISIQIYHIQFLIRIIKTIKIVTKQQKITILFNLKLNWIKNL